jgi:hypothetical protein
MIIVEDSGIVILHREWAQHLVLLHHVEVPREQSKPEWRLALYFDRQLEALVIKKLLRRDGLSGVKSCFMPLRADVITIGVEDLQSFQQLFAVDLEVLHARIAEVQLSQGKDQDIEF